MKTRRCVVCRREFLARRKDKRHCGVYCRVHAHRIRKGASARRPRTQHERAQKVERLFGVAATALAVAAVTRKLEAERTEHEKVVAALEHEKKTAADLRADNEHLRAEADAEKERLRAEFELKLAQQRAEAAERQDRRLKESAEAADERQRAALRDERAKANNILGQVYAQVRDLRFERARAVDEKRIAECKNTELLKERDELRGQLAGVPEQAKRLAALEQQNASLQGQLDEKTALFKGNLDSRRVYESLVAARHQQQLRDIERLRGQLGEAAAENQRVLQAKVSLERLLDEEIKADDRQSAADQDLRRQLGHKTAEAHRLSAKLQAAQKHLTAGAESYEDLRSKYNALVNRFNELLAVDHEQYEALRLKHNIVVERFNGQLAAFKGLAGRVNALATAERERYEVLRLKFNALVEKYNRLLTAPSYPSGTWAGDPRQLAAENVRLVAERDQLKEQLTQKTEAIAWLEATVSQQCQSLERLAAPSVLPAAGRARSRSLGRSDAENERIELESHEATHTIWGSIKEFCTHLALGGTAAALTLAARGSADRNQKSLHSTSQPEPKRIGQGNRGALPPSRGRAGPDESDEE